MNDDDNQYIKKIKADSKMLIIGDKNEQDIAALKKEIDKMNDIM